MAFSQSRTELLIAEIVIAVEQLHNLKIAHRDLKLENILLDTNDNIVVTDFGCAKLLENDRCDSFCGTEVSYEAGYTIIHSENKNEQHQHNDCHQFFAFSHKRSLKRIFKS